jgi:ADP-heptose:LPS heptosyltransferase
MVYMKLKQTEIKKIGILRALQLGDMLCSVPALRALRNAFPEAEIVLFGLPWAVSFQERFSAYIDGFIHFPGYPGLPEQAFDEQKYEAFLQQVRQQEFDLVLQMQGNGTIVNEMIGAFGAKRVAGFHNHQSRMFSDLFTEYPENLHEVQRHLGLMQHLGIPAGGIELEFPILQTDIDELRTLAIPGPGEYVCIHPGSRGSWRQWPPAHFAMLADLLYERGYEVIITGVASEKEIVRETAANMKYPFHDLAGKTGLGAMAQLIKDAAMIVCNCTGVSHIASAVKTPGLIISMDGEPFRWGPLDHSIHKTVDWKRAPDLEYVLLVFNTLAKKVLKKQALAGHQN